MAVNWQDRENCLPRAGFQPHDSRLCRKNCSRKIFFGVHRYCYLLGLCSRANARTPIGISFFFVPKRSQSSSGIDHDLPVSLETVSSVRRAILNSGEAISIAKRQCRLTFPMFSAVRLEKIEQMLYVVNTTLLLYP